MKVFNLMLADKWNKIFSSTLIECKCRLNDSVCNPKQKWNQYKCRCESKELDDWNSCKKDYIRSPSRCDCECNKTCKIDEHLDIENCSVKITSL